MKKEKQNQSFGSDLKQQNSTNPINPTKSEFNQQYINWFQPQFQVKNLTQFDQRISKQLQNQNIAYNTSQQSQFSFKMVKQSINSQVIVIQVKWGKFTVPISILNNSNHLLKLITEQNQIGKGSFGKIYKLNNFNNEVVLKCIYFHTFNKKREALIMAIKEYTLLKIISALSAGPKLQNYLNFDLILQQTCIYFAMQHCQQIYQLNFKKITQLKQNLYILHQLNIVHFDIKPQNIMFSPSLKKTVFIDFGLAQITKCRLGHTIQIQFRGTIEFCSPQMWQIFQRGTKKQIDIYYNDVYCLQKTINEFYHISKLIKPTNFEQTPQLNLIDLSKYNHSKKDNIHLAILKAKYLIFQNQITSLAHFIQTITASNRKKIIQEVLQFFNEVHPSQQQKIFYNQHICNHQKEGIQHLSLRKRFNVQHIYFNSPSIQIQKKNINRTIIMDLLQFTNQEIQQTLSKHQLLHLLNDDVKHSIDKSIILRKYLKLINFSNNVYNTSTAERVAASKGIISHYLNDNIIQIPVEQNITTINQLQYIKNTFRMLINFILKNEKQKTIKDKKITLQNIFELIQQIFVIKAAQ